MVTGLVLSIHDVAAVTSTESMCWLRRFDELGARCVLKVIPGPYRGRPLHDAPALVDELAAAVDRGHEICLHGWDHVAGPAPGLRGRVGRTVARGAEEFWMLDPDEGAARVACGRRVLEELGLVPAGFTPPGWLAPRELHRGLEDAGLSYVTDHFGVTDLVRRRRLRSPAWCYRGGTRARSVGATAVQRAVRATAARRDTVRLAVHPVDAADPRLVDDTVELVDDLMRRGVRPATFGELVAA